MSDDTVTRFSAVSLEAKRPGESRTDMDRLRRMTEEELREKIADDPDWTDLGEDWHLKAEAVLRSFMEHERRRKAG